MTRDRLLKKLEEGGVSPNRYSLGYELKNNACNIHTLPNAKYCLFTLDERGEKRVIKTNINFEEGHCLKKCVNRKNRGQLVSIFYF